MELLTEEYGQIPVFQWVPRISTMPEFRGSNKVSTVGMPNWEATRTMEKT